MDQELVRDSLKQLSNQVYNHNTQKKVNTFCSPFTSFYYCSCFYQRAKFTILLYYFNWCTFTLLHPFDDTFVIFYTVIILFISPILCIYLLIFAYSRRFICDYLLYLFFWVFKMYLFIFFILHTVKYFVCILKV